jgi:hypothetical protein
MLPKRWREIETLFHAACGLDPDQRRAYMESACGADEELRREVQSLLDNDNLAADFLES